MHQRILVPVDGSHTSTLGLQEAIRIAMDQRARLRLIKLGATRAEFEEALAMAVLYGWRSVTDVCGGGIGCIRGDVGRLMHFFLCCYGTDIQVRSFLQESDMHTVIWTIDVNEGTSRQDIQQGITASASDYRGVAGLIRTCFGIAADGRSIIEIYLWESKSAAEAFFTREWETEVSRRWQAAPMRRQDWDTPVVVDGG